MQLEKIDDAQRLKRIKCVSKTAENSRAERAAKFLLQMRLGYTPEQHYSNIHYDGERFLVTEKNKLLDSVRNSSEGVAVKDTVMDDSKMAAPVSPKPVRVRPDRAFEKCFKKHLHEKWLACTPEQREKVHRIIIVGKRGQYRFDIAEYDSKVRKNTLKRKHDIKDKNELLGSVRNSPGDITVEDTAMDDSEAGQIRVDSREEDCEPEQPESCH